MKQNYFRFEPVNNSCFGTRARPEPTPPVRHQASVQNKLTRAIHSSVQNICFRVCFRFSDTWAARRLKGYVKIAFESSVINCFI